MKEIKSTNSASLWKPSIIIQYTIFYYYTQVQCLLRRSKAIGVSVLNTFFFTLGLFYHLEMVSLSLAAAAAAVCLGRRWCSSVGLSAPLGMTVQANSGVAIPAALGTGEGGWLFGLLLPLLPPSSLCCCSFVSCRFCTGCCLPDCLSPSGAIVCQALPCTGDNAALS
jgi:hypothetical protein